MNKSSIIFRDKLELASPMSGITRKFSIPLALVEEDVKLYLDDFWKLSKKIDMALIPYGYKCMHIRFDEGSRIYYAIVEMV